MRLKLKKIAELKEGMDDHHKKESMINRGCHIRCYGIVLGLIESYEDSVHQYEKELASVTGIPFWTLKLSEAIFSRLSIKSSKKFSRDFIKVISELGEVDLDEIKSDVERARMEYLWEAVEGQDYCKKGEVLNILESCARTLPWGGAPSHWGDLRRWARRVGIDAEMIAGRAEAALGGTPPWFATRNSVALTEWMTALMAEYESATTAENVARAIGSTAEGREYEFGGWPELSSVQLVDAVDWASRVVGWQPEAEALLNALESLKVYF